MDLVTIMFTEFLPYTGCTINMALISRSPKSKKSNVVLKWPPLEIIKSRICHHQKMAEYVPWIGQKLTSFELNQGWHVLRSTLYMLDLMRPMGFLLLNEYLVSFHFLVIINVFFVCFFICSWYFLVWSRKEQFLKEIL